MFVFAGIAKLNGDWLRGEPLGIPVPDGLAVLEDERTARHDPPAGHHLARELRAQAKTQAEIRAEIVASLNGRPFQLLIDPDVDLANERRTIWGADWIEPLRES